MRFDYTQIHEGMVVYSSDGEKLGKVHRCDSSMFVIEKGFFFPKDYVARYDDVRTIDEDGIHLTMSKQAFQDLRDAEGTTGDEGWRAGPITTEGKPDTTTADTIGADYGLGAAGLGQPGMSGDLSRSAAAEQGRSAERSLGARTNQDTMGDLSRTKRPVVKEEVRFPKDRFVEQRAADAEIKKERVDVDDFGPKRSMNDPDDEFSGS